MASLYLGKEFFDISVWTLFRKYSRLGENLSLESIWVMIDKLNNSFTTTLYYIIRRLVD